MSYIHYRETEVVSQLLAKRSQQIAEITRLLAEVNRLFTDHLNCRENNPAQEFFRDNAVVRNIFFSDMASWLWQEMVVYLDLSRRVPEEKDPDFFAKIKACQTERESVEKLYREVVALIIAAGSFKEEETACARLNALYARSVRGTAI